MLINKKNWQEKNNYCVEDKKSKNFHEHKFKNAIN